MDRLIRSLIKVDGKEDVEKLLENYYKVVSSKLKFELQYHQDIFKVICEHFDKYKNPPHVSNLENYFLNAGREDIKKYFEIFKNVEFVDKQLVYSGIDFVALLDQILEKQYQREFIKILDDARNISLKETQVILNDSKVKLKGLDQAQKYISLKSYEILDLSTLAGTNKLSGDIRKETSEAKTEYDERALSPESTWGIPFGLEKIDHYTRGLKRKQLCIIAGYSAGGKTQFCMNALWKACTWYGKNVVLITIEMDRKEVRRAFYALHSNHPKFASANLPGLEYEKIKNGSLSKKDKDFYFDVLDDFKSKNNKYGSLRIEQPPTSFSFHELKHHVEMLDMKEPIDVLCIDYLGLLDMSMGSRKYDYRINFEKTIREAKQLALHFKNGLGLPIITPHQINRTGWLEATRTDPEGQYNSAALSETTEIEKSADLIITSYLSAGYKENNQAAIGCIKHRDGELIPWHRVMCNQKTRYIHDLYEQRPMAQQTDNVEAIDPDEVVGNIDF